MSYPFRCSTALSTKLLTRGNVNSIGAEVVSDASFSTVQWMPWAFRWSNSFWDTVIFSHPVIRNEISNLFSWPSDRAYFFNMLKWPENGTETNAIFLILLSFTIVLLLMRMLVFWFSQALRFFRESIWMSKSIRYNWTNRPNSFCRKRISQRTTKAIMDPLQNTWSPFTRFHSKP